MTEQVIRIAYDSVGDLGPVNVLRLPGFDEGQGFGARTALTLLRDGHISEFVNREAPLLTEGAVEKRFDPTKPEAVNAYARRIGRLASDGVVYWLAEAGDQEPLGVLKASPSLSGWERRLTSGRPAARNARANMYINDLMVNPDLQRHNIGRTLVHAAIVGGGYKPKATALASVYTQADQAAHFFEGLGFRYTTDLEDVTVFGDTYPLEQAQFEGLTLGDTKQLIEEKVPDLRNYLQHKATV